MLSEKTTITKPYIGFCGHGKRLLQNRNTPESDGRLDKNREIAVECT